jgi:hypothetical protein
MMAQYQAIKLGGFTPATDAESDILRTELGYGAWWDQYGVEPVTDPIREDIEGAEYIDRGEPGGYYIKPFGRGWAVCTDDTNLVHGAENIFHTLADTRFEALAKAWAMHRADVVKIEKMGRRSQLPPKRFWQFWR